MKLCMLLAVVFLASQTLFAAGDCTDFGFCSICTFSDDFTDEISSHELRCGSGWGDLNDFVLPGLVNVGCFSNGKAFVTLTKFQGERLLSNQQVLVRYRFDEDPAYSGTWNVYNQAQEEYSMAAYLDDELAQDVAEGIHNSERLIYEIDGFRSQIDFSQPESQNAVSELEERCGLNERTN